MINKEKYIVIYNDEVKGLFSQNCSIYEYNSENVEKQFKEKYLGCILIGIVTPEMQKKVKLA